MVQYAKQKQNGTIHKTKITQQKLATHKYNYKKLKCKVLNLAKDLAAITEGHKLFQIVVPQYQREPRP